MATSTEPAVYVHDGTEFDLSVPWADVMGVVWAWTGFRNAAGEPLMRAEDGRHEAAVSLPDLYLAHGPLIPVHGAPRIDRTSWLLGGAA